jgi:hypothetical protein
MSEETPQPSPPETSTSLESAVSSTRGLRYSLKEMMAEVVIDRRDSVFGRELVDASEIEKMFSKRVRKKRRK